VIAEHVVKLRDILVRLDAAGAVADMDLPGFNLHPLKGELKGFWAGNGSRQLAGDFPFVDRDAVDVDYVDYH